MFQAQFDSRYLGLIPGKSCSRKFPGKEKIFEFSPTFLDFSFAF